MLTRADLNETSPVCLFPTPRETITEVKIRIGGGRKIEIFGSGGATFFSFFFGISDYTGKGAI